MPDSAGKPQTEDGRYVTVWRRESDGEWRCVIDIWNAGP
jgi:ketosteroid isomerase-like protein